MKTINQAAAAAIQVQSACNLSGVVRSYAEALAILLRQPDCTGSEWVARHPVSVLFAVQVAWLTGIAGESHADGYSAAYAACVALASAEVAA